jgi:hypothetical protein
LADAGPPDAGHDAGQDAGLRCPPEPGAIVFVEVMVASRTGGSDLGEWFEVLNRGACNIDLTGMTIESPTAGGAPMAHTVTGGVIAIGEHYVFAQSPLPSENHGLPYDYAYGDGTAGIVLNNSNDRLLLRAPSGTVLDEVSWDLDWFYGASRQFPSDRDVTRNDLLSSWCDSVAVYSTAPGGPYLGTPGMPNVPCP